MGTVLTLGPGLHEIESKWDPIHFFEGHLQGIPSRTVGVYTGSDQFEFYELLAAPS